MTRDDFQIKIDFLERCINAMMSTDDIKKLSETYYYANQTLTELFTDNLDRIIKEEELKDQILEESSEIEDDYDVDVADCIRNCSTCGNNVEFPPPHTCDICTSLDQEEEYEMWTPKE